MKKEGKLKVLIKNNQLDIKIPTGIRMLIRRCCHAVLIEENFNHDAEISVTFVNNQEIQTLNNQYRGKNYPTDVLSFPLAEAGEFEKNIDGTYLLGDIVISIEKAVEQSKNYGHTLQREIGFLTVHSMFHLFGYDHEKGGLEAVKMREKEEIVLTRIGIPRCGSYVLEDE